ncbi:HTH-10 family transcription regulator (plasmid) [Natrialba magadii ATCC 43099]|uniref:Bacterio-opsin activator HTH domain-containing protein n=1 Tax=Natrialba magadii (strain ATCC 43099 / DSM 3394 / CCM 3739 / CIP 104546 / IAM 13178 / JCM 8861 / NBRC 102185 / NCIMB 2190 / MS3) TaxID=547559 RepID=D3T1B5_NATMM|nr:helix-turn-helix domain-containing protein [Natrialba magadii]ADD07374.1 HTH-10 family transcription regulator [Natrialba magadii ATCC 43099]ELY32444.1 bacterio-opsin activator HTH domain-containing protein [Natrialba magadii ATCC 43099]
MHVGVFRIDGGSPYAQSTARTNTSIELWCNDHCDLLHVTGDQQTAVVDRVSDEVGVRERIEQDETTQTIITDDCLKQHGDDYIESYLSAHGCLLVPPLRYEDGMKVVRVLAIDGANLSAFYRDIAADYAVTVDSKYDLDAVPAETPVLSTASSVPDLSERQREIFLLAYERGYYEIPRETTTAKLADSVGIGRRTVDHHLRRAEAKIAAGVVEFL